MASEEKYQRPKQTLSAFHWVTRLFWNQRWHDGGRMWGIRHTTDTGTENRAGMPLRGSGKNLGWPAQASTRPTHEVFPGLSPKQSCYHTILACHSILKAPGAPRCCWVFHNLVPLLPFQQVPFFIPQTTARILCQMSLIILWRYTDLPESMPVITLLHSISSSPT